MWGCQQTNKGNVTMNMSQGNTVGNSRYLKQILNLNHLTKLCFIIRVRSVQFCVAVFFIRKIVILNR